VADILVIGGGIIGAACASEFARRGADVTLVERDQLAAHASGRNQGLWILPHDAATVAMARLSLERYVEVASEAPIDVQLDTEPIGEILIARDDAERATVGAAVELAEREGVRVDPLGPAALTEAEPAIEGEVAEAWLIHSGHRLDPGGLTVALALEARAHGATVRHHLNARALARRGDRVVGAVTDDGVIEADTTVVAGGPWSSTLLEPRGVSLPVTGARGWLIRLGPAPIRIGHLVRAEPPVVHRQGRAPERPRVSEILRDGTPRSEVATIVLPRRDGSVLLGSSRQVWMTPEPSEADVLGRMLAAATRLMPSLREAGVVSTWWGVRPLSPDERPFVGPVMEGLAVATGHGSEGVILGAGSAALLAAQIAGEVTPFEPGPFAPLRFA
jgi:D-hydroxyproline dehydrogenase subunit beta